MYGVGPETLCIERCNADVGITILNEAEHRMVRAVCSSILDAFWLITDMVKDGVSADSLTKTTKVFVDVATPFMYPKCDKAIGR